MIDMFTNYQNLSEYYMPNNLCKQQTVPTSYTKLMQNNKTKPYELYNAKGELEGYYWHYGDHIELEFNLAGELTLDDDTPTGSFIDIRDFLANKNLIIKLYDFRFNIIHTKVSNTYYEALLDKNETWGDTIDFIDAGNAFSEYMIDTDPAVKLTIDHELSMKMVKGVYYCSLEVEGQDFHEILFGPEDCKLLVK